jgi:hypothetical protein
MRLEELIGFEVPMKDGRLPPMVAKKDGLTFVS